MSNDPRTVANFILRTRRHLGLDTTNLEMQKILFFCHSNYLLAFGRRLVLGHFEAWQYGPVHPIVYRSFKAFEGAPIQHEAEGVDPFTKKPIGLGSISDLDQRQTVMSTVANLSKLSAGQLVDLSHRRDGAWSKTVEDARSGGALGMRITDDTIMNCARRTKVVPIDSMAGSNGDSFAQKEVRHYVETPIAGYGSG